ncbi:uncharacterized protein LOC134447066 [Engraulis encrasicolus]|uniref:uncharacterized protein LOC134447066 n=1 Tax=Engraulis encrasicolus TaxID=184585 RepID=UPI002FD4BA11
MSSFKNPANSTAKELVALPRPNINDAPVLEIKISDVLDMEKRREPLAPWIGSEVHTFLSIMKQPRIQIALREGGKKVFAEVAQHMVARGFNRTSGQCREKMKKLRFDYRRIRDRNNTSGSTRPQWRWYDDMDAIYGSGPVSQSPDESMDPGLSLLTATNDSEDTVAFDCSSSSANSNDPCKESIMSAAQASSSAAEASYTSAASSTQAASFCPDGAQSGQFLPSPDESGAVLNGIMTSLEQQCWPMSYTEAFISLLSEVGIQAKLDGATCNEEKEEVFRDLSSKLQQRGIHRTSRQCREKLKKLRFHYFACKKSLIADDMELRHRTSQYKWFKLLLPVFDSAIATSQQNINSPATTGLQNTNPPATTGLQNTNPPATTGLQNIIPPATTELQNIDPPPTTGLQNMNPPSTTGLQNINPPSTTGLQNINPPSTTGLQNINLPATTGLQNIIPPATTGLQNINLPTTTGLQNIIPPATTGLQNINLPATAGLQNIIPPATTGLQNIILPATTGLQNIILPATTGLQNLLLPATIGLQNLLLPATIGLQNLLLLATTGLQNITPPASTGLQNIILPANTLSTAVPEKESGQRSHGSLRAVGDEVTSTNVSSLPPILDKESAGEEEVCSPSVHSSALQQAWHNVCLPTLALSLPLRMQSAFMWHVAQHRRVPQYPRLEEFVCTILEELPQLLDAKEKAELLLGLRTRFILELCRGTPSVNYHLIQPHLEKLRKISKLASADQNEEIGERGVDSVVKNFTSLIQTLLESPQEARRFFQDVFPVQYGPKYDLMLQSSVWEFLCRLEKLIPVPSFHQAASWFDENPSQWDNSLDIQPELLQTFLRHAKNAGLLDSAGSTLPITQNSILATLYATSTQFNNTCEEADAENILQISTSHQHQDSLSGGTSHGNVVGVAMDCTTEAEDSGANGEAGDEQTDGGCTSHGDATCNTRSEARSEEPTSSSKSEPGSQVTGSTLEAFPAEKSRKQKPYLCSHCGMVLKSKHALKYHILIHTGELPFGCTICGKRFRQPSTLLTHKRLHTGERTHLCSFCGKGFITAGHLRIHTRNHTGERPYKCEICGKTFILSSTLVVHSRGHNKERPYSCTVCEKRFATGSALTRHMRIHTGEKPYECILCGKRFAARATLKVHQRVHVNVKKFVTCRPLRHTLVRGRLIALSTSNISDVLEMKISDVLEMERRRSPAVHWSCSEVQTFLCFIRQPRIQNDLDRATRNEKVFSEVARHMVAQGFNRTSGQCREKLKKLRTDFRKIREHNDTKRPQWRWYDDMDAIYGSGMLSQRPNESLDPGLSLLMANYDSKDTVAFAGCSSSVNDPCKESIMSAAQASSSAAEASYTSAASSTQAASRFTGATRRGKNSRRQIPAAQWSCSEVQTFLCFIRQPRIQNDLDGATRNEKVFSEVARHMVAQGFNRTSGQCREKLRKLRTDFRKIRDHNHTKRPQWRWYEEMNSIYGSGPLSQSPDESLDPALSFLTANYDSDDTVAFAGCSSSVNDPSKESIMSAAQASSSAAEASYTSAASSTQAASLFTGATRSVCLPTLGLSVPPLRMQSAFMWHVAQHRRVPQYPRLEEFVCTILEELPQLLDAKEKAELLLGLRTRFILELCRGTPSVNIHLIQPHLEKLRKISKLASADQNEEIGERVVEDFTSLIQTLLESPQEARRFFQDVFPVQYGPKYDLMLQSSVWEFLCRLEKLIPVPSFHQAASWFDESPSQWDNSLDIQPELLQSFLRHAKNTGMLDSAGCTSPITQNSILATLSATSTQFNNTCEEADYENCVSTSYQCQDSLGGGTSHGDVVGMAMECTTEAEDSGANEEDGDEQTDGVCTSHEDATCNTRSEARSEEPTSSSKSEPGSQVTGSTLEAFPAEKSRKQKQPYLCSHCGLVLKSKYALKYHVLIHTGELPFGCTICGKRFRQPSTLLSHKRLHTGERTHLCSFCGKGFITAGALRTHTRNHTGERPYKCEICGKTYKQRCNLVVHSRRHNKERPYSCTVCEKRFGTRELLTRHMRTHTGEKPYECLLCGKRFAVRVNLKTHQRVHM